MSEDKRLNEVIRVQKRPNNFVTIDKGFTENPELSWKAKGILAYLLGKPDNWKVIVHDLINHAKDGRDSTKAGLRELKEHGYYSKAPVRDERGRVSYWEGTICEVPMESLEIPPYSPQTDFPSTVKPLTDNPLTENPPRNNNYINNTDFNNNQSSLVLSAVTKGRDKTELRRGAYSDLSTEDENAKIERMIKGYTLMVKENIRYNDLSVAIPYDMGLVDEIVAIIIDTIMSEGRTVRIGGEDKPRALVTRQLMKLTYSDIEHTVEQFKGVSERISKKKQYILTMLYNCKMELDSHYTNAVRSDIYQ